jgi:hypothetical protein
MARINHSQAPTRPATKRRETHMGPQLAPMLPRQGRRQDRVKAHG